MNRYIFLTSTVRNVGGAQLYLSRKVDWLKSMGWNVEVYFYNDGQIFIDNLKAFSNHCIPELAIPFELLNDRLKKKILNKINLADSDELIIESHLLNLCFWGEYIISQKGGMNLCFLLSESFPRISESTKKMIEYKLKQNLLFGITDHSIPSLLGLTPQTMNRGLPAVGNTKNNVCDIEDYEIPLSFDNKATIVSLGRLDKPYIAPMVDSIKKFASHHRNKEYNVIFIGDAAKKGEREKVLNAMDEEINVTVYCTGYLNPIPRMLLKKADVAIASSGCVSITKKEKVLTIAVDGEDYMALGVSGITTNNNLFRKDEPKIKIEDLLEDILEKKKYKKDDIFVNNHPNTGIDYTKHKAIIDAYRRCDAFNVDKWPLSTKKLLLKSLITTIGPKNYRRLDKIYMCCKL